MDAQQGDVGMILPARMVVGGSEASVARHGSRHQVYRGPQGVHVTGYMVPASTGTAHGICCSNKAAVLEKVAVRRLVEHCYFDFEYTGFL